MYLHDYQLRVSPSGKSYGGLFQQGDLYYELWWLVSPNVVRLFWGPETEWVNGALMLTRPYQSRDIAPGDLPENPTWEKLKDCAPSLFALAML